VPVQPAGQAAATQLPAVVHTPVAPHVTQPFAPAGHAAGAGATGGRGLGMGRLIGIHGLGRKKNFSSFLASAKTTVAIAAKSRREMNLFILVE